MENRLRVTVELDYPMADEYLQLKERRGWEHKVTLQRAIKLLLEQDQRERKLLEKAGK